jgi:siroheme decarboxylase
MDDTDKRLLTIFQAAMPLEARPFDALATRLGIAPEDCLSRVRWLVTDGTVRRIGPVFDSRQLGYASTLVAARVPVNRVEEVAARVSGLAGVTHNYERRHTYNLWFTLTAPSQEALDETLTQLQQETRAEFHSLPALTVYKIRVQFDLAEDADESSLSPQPSPTPGKGSEPAAPLNDAQKHLVRLIQDGLEVEREPFAPVAQRLGWTDEQVIEQIRAWITAGVIRRFGAVVRHHQLGFAANGMSVFRVAEDRIDEAGRLLAERAEVSHCYRRPPLADFPYNLFAMTHGRTEEDVLAAAAEMARQSAAQAYEVLFSVREFKKVSMRYFV